MSLNREIQEPEGLRVTVDRVVYNSQFATPPDRPYCFVYFISIRNGTNVSITFKARKWVVTNSCGEITAIEGDGVVGQCPTIGPGERFSYNSFHLVDTRTAVAEGSYLGIDATGQRVLVRIPRFQMAVPDGK